MSTSLPCPGAAPLPGRCGRGRCQHRCGGMALIAVLVLTAMLTSVLVLSLSLSARRAALVASEEPQQNAEQLGVFAQQRVLASLRAEMRAGFGDPQSPDAPYQLSVSTVTGAGNLWFPRNGWAAVPCRTEAGTATFAVPGSSLLKWSSRGAAFYTERVPDTYHWSAQFPPAPAAAPVSTLDKSLDGRLVSAKRWNATLLLPKADPTQTDTTPVNGPAPDWVLVSRSGQERRSLLTNATDPIIGRYAYMIYDEGGQLDLSVVGFPSGVGQAAGSAKNTPRLVSLFPALRAAGMSYNDAVAFNDAFVGWRDFGTLSHGSFPLNFRNFLAGFPIAQGGRLLPHNRVPVSRQALLKRVLGDLPGPLAQRQNFLQFAGTFSRALAQPSLALRQSGTGSGSPPAILPPAAGGNDLHGWDANYPNAAQHLNPPFLEIRVKSVFERLNGSRSAVGEPLVLHRFPLSRLAEMDADTVAGPGSRIEGLFGVTRAGADQPWEYRPGQGRILTLNEVANLSGALAREPDLLELLKAAINSGSLAKGRGEAPEEADISVDNAVVQIAVNLFDQYDADSLPTRIFFNRPSGGRVFSGVENLPYLYSAKTHLSILRESNPSPPFADASGGASKPFIIGQPSDAGQVLVWQELHVWNPHSVSVSTGSLSSAKHPVEFRLVVESGSKFGFRAVQKDPMQVGAKFIPGTSPGISAADTQIAGEQLLFSAKPVTGPFFSPVPLSSQSGSGGTINVEAGSSNLISEIGLKGIDGREILGVGIAKLPRVFSVGLEDKTYTVAPTFYQAEPAAVSTYRLQYKATGIDGSAQWITYDEKSAEFPAKINVPDSSLSFLFPDPRTSRFGAMKLMPGQTEADLAALFFQNTGADAGWYADPDGVVRRASGAGISLATPLGASARPTVLNRPFASVGEMANTFSGSPWKSLDFATPESGFSGLWDVFCVHENSNPNALEHGRVNLNTAQWPVLQGVLEGASLPGASGAPVALPDAGAFSSESLARALVSRTASRQTGRGPLRNLSDLSGGWVAQGQMMGGTLVGSAVYRGFSEDVAALSAGASGGFDSQQRRAAIQALADAGQVRVWNLLIDIIAQSGTYPGRIQSQGDLRNFVVGAERRLWVHAALDRCTGELIDLQVEHVEE